MLSLAAGHCARNASQWPSIARAFHAKLSRNEYLHGKTADATHGLGPDGVVWAKSTVDLFLNDIAHDNSVRALNDEYQLYFGALAPAADIAVMQH